MSSLTYLLSDTGRLLRRRFDSRVREHGVTGPQARLLLLLSVHEGENQGFYADRLDVEPITLCRMVDRMASTGLVERRPDPADRRAWRLHMTERSRAMSQRLHGSVDQLEHDIIAELAPGEQASLRALLARVAANLGGPADTAVTVNG